MYRAFAVRSSVAPVLRGGRGLKRLSVAGYVVLARKGGELGRGGGLAFGDLPHDI